MRTPEYQIYVNGKEARDRFKDHLIRLEVADLPGYFSDRLTLVLRDNGLPFPSPEAELAVSLGYAETEPAVEYEGYYPNRIRHTGPPAQLEVDAHAMAFPRPAIQEERDETYGGDGSGVVLDDLVATLAERNGFEPRVHPDLQGKRFGVLDQRAETDLEFLDNTANDFDFLVKVVNNKLYVTPYGAETARNGEPVPKFPVTPKQVTSWRFEHAYRDHWPAAKAKYHDFKKAQTPWVTAGEGRPVKRVPGYWESHDEAEMAAKAAVRRARLEELERRLERPGDPRLFSQARVELEGFARDQVDGEWLVQSVRHSLDSRGYRSSVTLEAPPRGTL